MNYFFTFINVVVLALLGYIIYQQMEEHKYYDKDNIIIQEVVANEVPAEKAQAKQIPSTEATDAKTPDEAEATTSTEEPAVVVEVADEATSAIETPEVPAVESGDDEEVVEKVTEDEE